MSGKSLRNCACTSPMRIRPLLDAHVLASQNTSLNLPIWTSSAECKVVSSTRAPLTYVPFKRVEVAQRDPTARRAREHRVMA